jgi:hypothetical protein
MARSADELQADLAKSTPPSLGESEHHARVCVAKMVTATRLCTCMNSPSLTYGKLCTALLNVITDELRSPW